MAASKGIFDSRIDGSPIAIIDFETTGLTPGVDRVVEVSVIKIEPGEKPTVALVM
jgi:DNA polymerase-3 subunit epsilon